MEPSLRASPCRTTTTSSTRATACSPTSFPQLRTSPSSRATEPDHWAKRRARSPSSSGSSTAVSTGRCSSPSTRVCGSGSRSTPSARSTSSTVHEGYSLRSAEPAVARDVDPIGEQALADEVLERRPGAALRIEHPVHLPLGEEGVVALPRLRPVRELGQALQPARELGALLDGALDALLPHGDVEHGLAQRVRERAERVPVQRLGRDGPLPGVEVTGSRRPAELFAELSRVVGERPSRPALAFSSSRICVSL